LAGLDAVPGDVGLESDDVDDRALEAADGCIAVSDFITGDFSLSGEQQGGDIVTKTTNYSPFTRAK